MIVGARCAGSPLATMLARRGLRVCLLDRAEFPSETLSTHVIQSCGVEILDRLRVLDTVLAAGAVPLSRFTLVVDDARVDAEVEDESLGPPGLCVRRIVLDHLLVEAAAAAGAEVRTGAAATGLLWEDGRVAGVTTAAGPLRARLVVGADGRKSSVAAWVGAPEYHVAPPGRVFAWAYFEGVADREPRLRLGSLGRLAFVASPTDAGLFMAAVCPPWRDRDAFLRDRERNFMAGLEGWPELADLLAGANRVGPIRVMANWHGYFRRSAGPGWALLGDAGHFKDPSPAQGIADAFRQAERLADTLEGCLCGAAEIEAELHAWWQWRDRDCYEMHGFAADMGGRRRGRGAGQPQPVSTQVIRDISAGGDEEALLRMLNREVLPSELFTWDRIGRAVVRVVRERPRQIPAMAGEFATTARNEGRRWRQRRRAARLLRI